VLVIGRGRARVHRRSIAPGRPFHPLPRISYRNRLMTAIRLNSPKTKSAIIQRMIITGGIHTPLDATATSIISRLLTPMGCAAAAAWDEVVDMALEVSGVLDGSPVVTTGIAADSVGVGMIICDSSWVCQKPADSHLG